MGASAYLCRTSPAVPVCRTSPAVPGCRTGRFKSNKQVFELSVLIEKPFLQLSVLIPIYNQSVVALAQVLCAQGTALGIDFEVRCYDDASPEPHWLEENRQVARLHGAVYAEMPQNLGRAAIRNRLADDARGQYLLFLDGDARIDDPLFLSKYWAQATPGRVVCGVKQHPTAPPSESVRLHWLYGSRRESVPASARQRHPWRSFNTFSFLVEKSLFQKIRFEESLREYGHEDTLFGLELRRTGVAILHTDIGAWHEGMDETAVFLKKNSAAVANLLWLSKRFPDLRRGVKLLRVFALTKTLGLRPLLRWAYRFAKGYLLRKLQSSSPTLWALDLFKLGELLSQKT